MNLRVKDIDTSIPSNKEIKQAASSSRLLSDYMKSTKRPVLQLIGNKEESQNIDIPAKALGLLLNILEEMGRGHGVSLTPINSELTTTEAADLLNVSRPFLITLLDKGEIPHRKVGSKRRILAKDMLAYKQEIDRKREENLAKLIAQAQELDMGY